MSQIVHNFSNPILACAFNKDASEVAITSYSSDIRIYGVPNLQGDAPVSKSWPLLKTLKGHDDVVSGLDWAPESNRIVSCSHDRNAFVWLKDVNGDWVQQTVQTRLQRAALCVQWSDSEQKIAIGGGDKNASVAYFDELNKLWICRLITRSHDSSVVSVSWNHDSTLLATGSTDRRCRIFSSHLPEIDGYQQKHGVLPLTCMAPFGTCLMEIYSPGSEWINSVVWGFAKADAMTRQNSNSTSDRKPVEPGSIRISAVSSNPKMSESASLSSPRDLGSSAPDSSSTLSKLSLKDAEAAAAAATALATTTATATAASFTPPSANPSPSSSPSPSSNPSPSLSNAFDRFSSFIQPYISPLRSPKPGISALDGIRNLFPSFGDGPDSRGSLPPSSASSSTSTIRIPAGIFYSTHNSQFCVMGGEGFCLRYTHDGNTRVLKPTLTLPHEGLPLRCLLPLSSRLVVGAGWNGTLRVFRWEKDDPHRPRSVFDEARRIAGMGRGSGSAKADVGRAAYEVSWGDALSVQAANERLANGEGHHGEEARGEWVEALDVFQNPVEEDMYEALDRAVTEEAREVEGEARAGGGGIGGGGIRNQRQDKEEQEGEEDKEEEEEERKEKTVLQMEKAVAEAKAAAEAAETAEAIALVAAMEVGDEEEEEEALGGDGLRGGEDAETRGEEGRGSSSVKSKEKEGGSGAKRKEIGKDAVDGEPKNSPDEKQNLNLAHSGLLAPSFEESASKSRPSITLEDRRRAAVEAARAAADAAAKAASLADAVGNLNPTKRSPAFDRQAKKSKSAFSSAASEIQASNFTVEREGGSTMPFACSSSAASSLAGSRTSSLALDHRFSINSRGRPSMVWHSDLVTCLVPLAKRQRVTMLTRNGKGGSNGGSNAHGLFSNKSSSRNSDHLSGKFATASHDGKLIIWDLSHLHGIREYLDV